MAASEYYHQLSLGEKFYYNSKVYQKIKPVMKNCCRQLYNSICVDDPNDRIIVPGNVLVQVYEDPNAPPGGT